MYVKGAIEQILNLSKRYLRNEIAVPITEEKTRQISWMQIKWLQRD